MWVTPGGLHVETEAGAEHATWPFESLRLAGRPVRGEPLRLERGAPVTETLVIADAGILGALRTASPAFGARAPSPRAGLTASFALGMIGAALAAMVALYVWGVPRRSRRSRQNKCRSSGSGHSASPRSPRSRRRRSASRIPA